MKRVSGDSGDLKVKRGIEIPADELEMTFARSGGPGGQHVNKTSTKVVLRFDLEASSAFTEGQKERLRERIPPRFLTKKGEVVISSDEHRDQVSNREAARARLAAVLKGALARPKRRIPTRPTRGSKERRLKAKQITAEKKQRRKPPKRLD